MNDSSSWPLSLTFAICVNIIFLSNLTADIEFLNGSLSKQFTEMISGLNAKTESQIPYLNQSGNLMTAAELLSLLRFLGE